MQKVPARNQENAQKEKKKMKKRYIVYKIKYGMCFPIMSFVAEKLKNVKLDSPGNFFIEERDFYLKLDATKKQLKEFKKKYNNLLRDKEGLNSNKSLNSPAPPIKLGRYKNGQKTI